MSESDFYIKTWKEREEKYESGKFRGYLPKAERMKYFYNELGWHLASLTLGREFNEKIDSYLERKGLKQFEEWANKERQKIAEEYKIPKPKWIEEEEKKPPREIDYV